MKISKTLLAAGLLATTAMVDISTATAAPFDIANTGKWTAVVPAGVPNLSGVGTAQINWGNPVPSPGPNSGYRWVPIPVTGIADLLVPPNPPGGFVIGQFTHQNFIIGEGESISQATLSLSISITDTGPGGAPPQNVNFSFNFGHNETPNQANPCPVVGGPPPANGCPDVVSFPAGFANEDIDFGPGIGIKTLQLLGFLIDANDDKIPDDNNIVQQFITSEAQDNHALLVVRFSDPPPRVPEPAGLGLLGLGLLGLGYQAYRRRKSA